jgi:colanic acid/amylovoran biosynthesis protein
MKNKPINILVIGQTTMELGRMEWGNIGNYYVLEPFFHELQRVFPNSNIRTTLQLSEEFCVANSIKSLDEDVYCNFKFPSVEEAKGDLEAAYKLANGKNPGELSRFVQEIIKSDIVVDFSGDIWGRNAELLGEGRFELGLYRDRTAQVLGKITALMCSSPGPFSNEHLVFAKEVFENFDLVANREDLSSLLLKDLGFTNNRLISAACPAFLYETSGREDANVVQFVRDLKKKCGEVVGFVVCGFNFIQGPHNRWPRDLEEYLEFVLACENLIASHDCHLLLFSHSNGFSVPPLEFQIQHGSDFKHAQMMADILVARGHQKSVTLLDRIYSPHTTKKIIGECAMFVSGRIHGAVAGFSQYIPTCVIDYGHEPKAHKLKGFVKLVDADRFLSDPSQKGNVKQVVDECWRSRHDEQLRLSHILPKVRQSAHEAFDELQQTFLSKNKFHSPENDKNH